MLSRALLNSHQRPGPPRDAQFSSMERQSYRGLSISNTIKCCLFHVAVAQQVQTQMFLHMGMEKGLGSY